MQLTLYTPFKWLSINNKELEKLFIEQTEFTPEVSFDHVLHELRITGVSRPEDVGNFYNPALSWLNGYKDFLAANKASSPIIVEFFFNYFNSASAKMILQLLEIIKEMSDEGNVFVINWIFEDGDEQVKEDGEELAFALDLDFNYYPR